MVKSATIESRTRLDRLSGRRLIGLLWNQVPRTCSRNVRSCPGSEAGKLDGASSTTAYGTLAANRHRPRLLAHCTSSARSLRSAQIHLKLAVQWDRRQFGSLQIDCADPSGHSTSESHLRMLSSVDVASNRWERALSHERTQNCRCIALDNALVVECPATSGESVQTTRPASIVTSLWTPVARIGLKYRVHVRPKQEDHCWGEQKNWTHAGEVVGGSPSPRATPALRAARSVSPLGFSCPGLCNTDFAVIAAR